MDRKEIDNLRFYLRTAKDAIGCISLALDLEECGKQAVNPPPGFLADPESLKSSEDISKEVATKREMYQFPGDYDPKTFWEDIIQEALPREVMIEMMTELAEKHIFGPGGRYGLLPITAPDDALRKFKESGADLTASEGFWDKKATQKEMDGLENMQRQVAICEGDIAVERGLPAPTAEDMVFYRDMTTFSREEIDAAVEAAFPSKFIVVGASKEAFSLFEKVDDQPALAKAFPGARGVFLERDRWYIPKHLEEKHLSYKGLNRGIGINRMVNFLCSIKGEKVILGFGKRVVAQKKESGEQISQSWKEKGLSLEELAECRVAPKEGDPFNAELAATIHNNKIMRKAKSEMITPSQIKEAKVIEEHYGKISRDISKNLPIEE